MPGLAAVIPSMGASEGSIFGMANSLSRVISISLKAVGGEDGGRSTLLCDMAVTFGIIGAGLLREWVKPVGVFSLSNFPNCILGLAVVILSMGAVAAGEGSIFGVANSLSRVISISSLEAVGSEDGGRSTLLCDMATASFNRTGGGNEVGIEVTEGITSKMLGAGLLRGTRMRGGNKVCVESLAVARDGPAIDWEETEEVMFRMPGSQLVKTMTLVKVYTKTYPAAPTV